MAAGGPRTETAYRFGRKHHSKSRRRNESDHHSTGFTRPGEGNAVQTALESLQRHERYTRATTDTSERRDDEKGRAAREAEETEAAGSAAVDRVQADISDCVPKTLKNKAKQLVERLKADTKVEWVDRGEFVCDGMAVTGSNMVDLVKNVLR